MSLAQWIGKPKVSNKDWCVSGVSPSLNPNERSVQRPVSESGDPTRRTTQRGLRTGPGAGTRERRKTVGGVHPVSHQLRDGDRPEPYQDFLSRWPWSHTMFGGPLERFYVHDWGAQNRPLVPYPYRLPDPKTARGPLLYNVKNLVLNLSFLTFTSNPERVRERERKQEREREGWEGRTERRKWKENNHSEDMD